MTCFFFSSRRRHTRYWRDWSSDVCSADLVEVRRSAVLSWEPPRITGRRGVAGDQVTIRLSEDEALVLYELLSRFRSGERRVGEECRSRWSAYHLKKN